ncbi:hypothetical protein ATN83_1437 [Raoultella ornithinolytica]|nr:hypothetical protein ATN83_1437 [Raoultella ornithinolytica]KDV92789.1 hypothetical protein AB00_3438 [Raoultella ornithinolytica 2-156-04_S1_C1]KDX13515.1 hypothetical protein AB28_3444 [Raoultella ornithinolytica 2-156-04_S1_C2]
MSDLIWKSNDDAVFTPWLNILWRAGIITIFFACFTLAQITG